MAEKELDTRVALLEHDLCEIKDNVKQIRQAIIGNGSPGMRIEIDRLKRQQTLIWWAISSVGSGLMGLVGYIIRGII